jgi:hypothetical protein
MCESDAMASSDDDLTPGDSSALSPARGLESLWRMQFAGDVDGHAYVLEADVLDWDEKCVLYRDGEQVAVAASPATFHLAELDNLRIEAPEEQPAVPRRALPATSPLAEAEPVAVSPEHLSSARIEARIGWFGMRRAHIVDDAGVRELSPLKGSWEHRRSRWRARHPFLVALATVVALLLLVGALFLELTQSVQWVTRKDWFDAISGWDYTAPVDLPLPANIAVTLAGIFAALACVLSLRHRWISVD